LVRLIDESKLFLSFQAMAGICRLQRRFADAFGFRRPGTVSVDPFPDRLAA
jgi:hypothetical protein